MLQDASYHIYNGLCVEGVSFFERDQNSENKCFLKGYGKIMNDDVKTALRDQIITAFNDMYGKKYFPDNCDLKLRFASMECCVAHKQCTDASNILTTSSQLEILKTYPKTLARVCLMQNFVHNSDEYDELRMEKEQIGERYKLCKPQTRPQSISTEPTKNIYSLLNYHLDGFITVKIVGICLPDSDQDINIDCIKIWCHIIESHFRTQHSSYVENIMTIEEPLSALESEITTSI